MVGPRYSLLDWAFGWPEGVRILLDFGADPMQIHTTSLSRPGVGYYSSIEMLLKAGGMIGLGHIDHALRSNDDEEIILLLVNELAVRRKQLRSIAESFLPLNLIPGSMESKLLDGPDCLQVLDLLYDCKANLPHPFNFKAREFLGIADGTVYHNLWKPQCAKALYKAGFLDTDMLDSKGSSPLEALSYCDVHTLANFIHWHISKGANIHRAPLWANESIALFLTWKMVRGTFFCSISEYYRDHQSVHLPQIESNLQELIKMGDDFFAPTTISDGCPCPCSLNGCTAISVSLRELTSEVMWGYSRCLECEREAFDFLQEWDQSYWQNPRAFIRSLTFNALDLNHTCFANTSKGHVLTRYETAGSKYYVNDNSNEQSSLDEFEILLEDLEQKFVESGQPLKDFLPGYWYRRVKDHLLTRQPDDEKHLKDVRSVGVELEFCGLSVPKWMETCIARKVEELNDEAAVNG
ncbi:uncharacterized protein N7506_009697 [Penicillium brevicompactum]|uniref:uncharacterized protein n=1 Tax=Penicillium brevicompactum TaxID=5074 RepID=UPI0025406140|nr:uncharacterized protein N7506_009697 [Penicillium brevicompactum]KAJ5326595.1 hypothetical protein N7506_009697 [Penicillium brevicompactum]